MVRKIRWLQGVLLAGLWLLAAPLQAVVVIQGPGEAVNYERFYSERLQDRIALNATNFSYAEGDNDRLNPSLLIGSYSHYFPPAWELEVRLGLSGRGDGATISNVATNLSIDRLYGLYGRVNLPAGPYMTLHGIVGYTGVKNRASGIGSEAPRSLSYGFGLRYMWLEQVSVDVELMRYIDTGSLTIDAFGLGIGLHF